jgi:mycobactin lysine-N-oxygenase
VKKELGLDQHNNNNLVRGEIKSVQKKNRKWHVSTYIPDKEQDEEIVCDALVFTGPGEPKRFRTQAITDIVMDGHNFWKPANLTWVQAWRTQKKTFAVIGTGETAASVIGKLIDLDRESKWEIHVISRGATLYSRGEGYHENRFFSDPADWPKLSIEMRKELIKRTDRGVLSLKAIRAIAGAKNVKCMNGEVSKILKPDAQARVFVKEDGGVEKPWSYDCVIVAMGFDAFSFAKYFVNEKIDDLAPLYDGDRRPDPKDPEYGKRVEQVAAKIGEELSVQGMEPKLYLPMFAGLMQGPGFPNLSCLGLLSDRILKHGVGILNQEQKKASNV